MDLDWGRHIVIGLVSALAVFALTTWGGKSPPDQAGWRNVRPGGTYAFGIGAGVVLTFLFSYIWLFAGSSRPDGAQQMRILFWLILAFSAGTLITLVQFGQARRTAMRWRGDTLVWHGKGGAEYSRKLSDAIALRKPMMGPVKIIFSDGAEARIDPYTTNAELLLKTISDRLDLSA